MENAIPVSKEENPFTTVDTHDPLAQFFRHKLKLTWTSLWILALLYFGPFEKLLLPALGDFLQLNVGIRQWVPHIEALLTGFVEFPVFLAFYLWSGEAVVTLFADLRKNNNFSDLNAYDEFVNRALDDFRKKLWIIIGFIFGILTAVVMHFVIWSPNAVVPPWFGDRLWMRALGLFNIGFVAYTVSQSITRELLVIIWLGRLWRELGGQLEIRPYHEDQAGGLGGIGRHTVFFVFFVVVLMLFILMATFIPSFLAEAGAGVRLWSPFMILMWVCYLIVIPLMIFLMIWPTHTIMLAKRAEELQIYSSQLDSLLDKAAQNSSKDPKAFKETIDEVENLKRIRALILTDYPVWPLSGESRNLVGLTSALPTLYSAITFIVGFLS